MQFIHWLLKTTHENRLENSASSSAPTNHKGGITNDDEKTNQVKHIIVFKHNGVDRGEKINGSKRGKSSCKKYLKIFLLCRRDIASSCFNSTINLKNPSDRIINERAQQYWINSMKLKKEDIIAKALVISKIDQAAAAASNGGNKVLPISDTNTTTNNDDTNEETESTLDKREKSKGEKGKAMSRMKELLRWAAAAKSDKGAKFIGRKVLQFRNRTSLKSVNDDDQFSYESPKISFRWDVESCSTTSSVYSAISITSLKNNPKLSTSSIRSANNNSIQDCENAYNPSRKGNWITTDSEFVVLEL